MLPLSMPLQISHSPQGSPPLGWRQLTGLGENLRAGGLACAAHAGEQVGVAYAARRYLIAQRRDDAALCDDILKPLGSPFAV